MGNQGSASDHQKLTPLDLDEILELCRNQKLDALPGIFTRYGSSCFTAQFAPGQDSIEHPDLRFLLEHYVSLPRPQGLPLWDEQVPFDLRRMLPNLHVLDFIAENRMRFRIFGTAVAQYYGNDYTGQAIADNAPSVSVVFHALAIVTSQQRTTLYTQHAPPDNSRVFDCQRLFLPFCNESGEVHRLLIAQYPYRRAPVDARLSKAFVKPGA